MDNKSGVFSDLEKVLRGLTGKNLEIGIMTAENPKGEKISDAENNKRNEALYRELRNYSGSRVFPISGNFEGLNENSFIVTGIPLETIKQLAKKYQQKAFIYGTGTNDNMQFHYMEAPNFEDNSNYEGIQVRRTFIYKPDATQNYSYYKGVRFLIPFFDDSYTDVRWNDLSPKDRGEEGQTKENRGIKMESTRIDRIKNIIENLKIDEEKKVKIKVKHPGVLEIPEDKNFWQMPQKHFVDLVDKKGYAKISKALTNLVTWNKEDDPSIAAKAEAIHNKLKKKFRPEEE